MKVNRLIVMACSVVSVAMFFVCGHVDHNYISKKMVTDVDNGVITCDHDWEFYGDDYHVGQFIELKMNDNNTPDDPYDDIIVDVL